MYLLLLQNRGYSNYTEILHTAFLFRFDESNATLIQLQFNIECDKEIKMKISKQLLSLAKKEGVNLVLSSNYELQNTNKEKEEFKIIFN